MFKYDMVRGVGGPNRWWDDGDDDSSWHGATAFDTNLCFTQGKYKGRHISVVFDHSYIQWVIDHRDLNSELREYIIQKKLPRTLCQFGKYKGKYLSDITNKTYINWVIENTKHSYFKYLL